MLRRGHLQCDERYVAWSGSNWIEQNPANRPPARVLAAMAYDASTKQLVLFGGYGSHENNLSDTWIWTGKTWHEAHPTTHPPSVHDATMGYDPSSHRLILFGGSKSFNNDPLAASTWAWNGTTWQHLKSALTPPGLSAASMDWDKAMNQLILFGGCVDGSYTPAADTWAWTGKTWTELDPTSAPPARCRASMAMDTKTKEIVVYGGYGAGLTNLEDTWAWNGSNWVDLNPSSTPPALSDAALGYSSASSGLILFGGTQDEGTQLLNGTWLLQG